MSTITELGTLALSGTKKGKISISNVTEPYGKDTEDIVSIGISLNGQDIQWKSHLPYENLEDVIAILQKALDTKKQNS
jgi:predicted RNA-binding protein with RPS1 domain